MKFDEIIHFLNDLGHGELFEIPIEFDSKNEQDPMKIKSFAIISEMKKKIAHFKLSN